MNSMMNILALIVLAIFALIGLFGLIMAGTDVGKLCGLLVMLCVWIICLLREIASNTRKA